MATKNVSAHEIRQKHYNTISESDFTTIISADTISSNHQKGKIGKYAKWLLNLFKNNRLLLEDLYKAREYIPVFDKSAKMNKLSNKDLNHYKSLSDMFMAIRPFIKIESKTEKIQKIKEDEAEKLYEDLFFTVIYPKTKAASILYGKGTQWCTAAKKYNNFSHYHRMGKLYIVIDRYSGKKYQFHKETDSYMNEYDRQLLNIDSEYSVLAEIKATSGLIDFFKKEIPNLYDEYRLKENYKNHFTEVFDCTWCTWEYDDWLKSMCHKHLHKGNEYYIGVTRYTEFDTVSDKVSLYSVKEVEHFLGFGIETLIDDVEMIVPFKDKNRQHELIIRQKKQYGIYNIDTKSIRWGYKGVVNCDVEWIKRRYVGCPF